MASCILTDLELETLICEAFPDIDTPDQVDALSAEIGRLRTVTDRVLVAIATGADELTGTPAAAGFARLLQGVAGGIAAAA